jgi:hypothetical protein
MATSLSTMPALAPLRSHITNGSATAGESPAGAEIAAKMAKPPPTAKYRTIFDLCISSSLAQRKLVAGAFFLDGRKSFSEDQIMDRTVRQAGCGTSPHGRMASPDPCPDLLAADH